MDLRQKYFKGACLASIAILLGACSSSGVIKPETHSAEVIKPTSSKTQKIAAKSVQKPVVIVKTAALKKTQTVARAPAKTVARAPKKKVMTRAYVPPKPIVVAVHSKPAARKAVSRPAPRVVRRPAVVKKPVITRKPVVVARAPVPQYRAAIVPVRAASRPVYKAPKQQQQRARVQQASYRPAPKPQARRVVPQQQYKRYSQSRMTGDFAGNRQTERFINMMVARHGFDGNYVTGVLSKAKATPWLKKMAYSDAHPKLRKKSGKAPNWSRYQSRFITSKHINTGTAFYNKYSRSLKRAASQYGIPEEYILGIMGVETIYGGNVGTDRAIDALATMSFMNSRRGKYFTSELESYLLMTRSTGLDPLKPKASYAGALGLPQFMPSNIKKYGVDYDGDGAVNLWTPHDAIGSIANYLQKHGWKRGEIAAIPAKRTGGRGYGSMKSGFKYKYSLTTLARKGLAPTYPGVSGKVNMVKLRTNSGNEYWVGGNNFYVITRYNHSTHYAMAVHQLAQEIRKRVKPRRALPRVIEAQADQNLLLQAASNLL